MCIQKSAGLALLTLCLIAGRSEVAGIETCTELMTGIDDGETEFLLDAAFTCTTAITIGEDNSITINGDGYSIAFNFGSSPTNDAAFFNQGGLSLNSVTISPSDGSENIRGIYNEGNLNITDSVIDSFNIADEEPLENGGAIYSDSTYDVTIEGSLFTSNAARTKGGAIYAKGTETLKIYDTVFEDNEAGVNDDGGTGSGGDIYAADTVTLEVVGSTFSRSSAEIGGAAIECCGGTIDDCDFINAESGSENDDHYGGALLVGRPDNGCSNELVLSNSNFSSCSVNQNYGVGGSIAIFDTDASIKNCFFERSVGTAVLFESSSSHEIEVVDSKFYENYDPAVEFANDGNAQATAFVIQYTGEDDETAPMVSFDTIFCYMNDPYECEFVYIGANVISDGEFKCQICSLDGDRLPLGYDDDELFEDETDADSSSSSSDSNTGIVIGLSLALGLTLVVIGALAVWKFRVRKNARRLMEDMGDNDI